MRTCLSDARTEALRIGFWNEGLMDTREADPTDDCD